MLGLKQTAELYRAPLSNVSNCMLLKKALDAGQISIFDSVDGIEAYYEIFTQVLETERDYQKVFAKLTAVEL